MVASLVTGGALVLAMIAASWRAAVRLAADARIPIHVGSPEHCLLVSKRAGLVIWPAVGAVLYGVIGGVTGSSLASGWVPGVRDVLVPAVLGVVLGFQVGALILAQRSRGGPGGPGGPGDPALGRAARLSSRSWRRGPVPCACAAPEPVPVPFAQEGLMNIDNSPARGMRDLLPADVAVRDHVLESIMAVYRRFGYQRIETPALENIDRLQSGEGADNEKLIYQVLRRGLPPEVAAGTALRELVDLGLRYDLTVPLTRFYGHNHASLPSPFRSLQVGPVWRAERPQRGRYRQFYQCDIDMIGEPSVLAEAELIEATSEALAAVGLTGTTVRLSDRRFLSALASDSGVPADSREAFFITLDKLDKIGWAGVRSELAELGSSPACISAVEETIRGLEDLPAGKLARALAEGVPGLAAPVIEDLVTTASCLDRLSSERPLTWRFDPTLVRGMGYYTGQVFEIIHPDGSGSLAGGGRYDKLIGRSLGRDVPACGFSIGFERIVDLLARRTSRDALAVLVEADVPVADALEVARELRGAAGPGQVVETVRRSGKFGAQLHRLEAAGFTRFVLVRSVDGAIVHGEERSLGG
ncbi:MAG TPA: histidine--tRNA ligase [Streptosporangiaceae bacterium]|nr:histidine--tRNA ligase [Streptosporangiaceae bacterium]